MVTSPNWIAPRHIDRAMPASYNERAKNPDLDQRTRTRQDHPAIGRASRARDTRRMMPLDDLPPLRPRRHHQRADFLATFLAEPAAMFDAHRARQHGPYRAV